MLWNASQISPFNTEAIILPPKRSIASDDSQLTLARHCPQPNGTTWPKVALHPKGRPHLVTGWYGGISLSAPFPQLRTSFKGHSSFRIPRISERPYQGLSTSPSPQICFTYSLRSVFPQEYSLQNHLSKHLLQSLFPRKHNLWHLLNHTLVLNTILFPVMKLMTAREKCMAMLTGFTLNSWPLDSNRCLELPGNITIFSLFINSHTLLDYFPFLPFSKLQYFLSVLIFSWQSCLYINEKIEEQW